MILSPTVTYVVSSTFAYGVPAHIETRHAVRKKIVGDDYRIEKSLVAALQYTIKSVRSLSIRSIRYIGSEYISLSIVGVSRHEDFGLLELD